MTNELEAGVPVPRGRIPYKRRITAEVASMEAGQSLLVDTPTMKSLTAYARYHGWTFTTETQGGGQFRFWRVS